MREHTHFHLFTYGTLCARGGAAHLLDDCERLGPAEVPGILYDVEGRYPALMLYGEAPVHGELWRCPVSALGRLDAYEGVAAGLFRRVAVQVDSTPAWTYVAGPGLARHLTADARLGDGEWRPPDSPG
jgi:gamma-glutamylcyclotransferase (GGCT)/AIG2-like uncharacterized protein YtfP